MTDSSTPPPTPDSPTPDELAAAVLAPPPASPYGPADTLGPADGGASNAAPAQYPAWVDRGRRILSVAIWIMAGISVALTIVIVVLGVTNAEANDLGVEDLADTLVWSTIFAAPISFTIAINLLVWRALLRGLSGRTPGGAFALVAVIAISLAVVSVILVTVLLFLGFLIGASTGVGV